MPREHTTTHLARAGGNAHILQLFDTSESLATAVSAFLFEGWTRGEHLLVIVKPQNWKGIRARFERRGCDVARAMADERLTLLDAHDTLARIMQGTMPDERAFCEIVEPRLHRASEGRPVRVFGELVELLAEEQNYSAARELETAGTISRGGNRSRSCAAIRPRTLSTAAASTLCRHSARCTPAFNAALRT